jgi:hypothetical protein
VVIDRVKKSLDDRIFVDRQTCKMLLDSTHELSLGRVVSGPQFVIALVSLQCCDVQFAEIDLLIQLGHQKKHLTSLSLSELLVFFFLKLPLPFPFALPLSVSAISSIFSQPQSSQVQMNRVFTSFSGRSPFLLNGKTSWMATCKKSSRSMGMPLLAPNKMNSHISHKIILYAKGGAHDVHGRDHFGVQ